jgi:hypothetical protein
MKTKINGASLTTEEREQFIMLYYGQQVLCWNSGTFLYKRKIVSCNNVDRLRLSVSVNLSLKSLSSINEEDAIAAAIWLDVDYIKSSFSGKHGDRYQLTQYSADTLRRKGYLLGATLMNKEGVCTHYTAEELIEDGVAKIRE